MKNARLRRTLTALACAACVGLSAACSQDITSNTIRKDPSPELDSLALSNEMRANRKAIVWDVNARQINDDWDHFWLEDRPVRLNRLPIP